VSVVYVNTVVRDLGKAQYVPSPISSPNKSKVVRSAKSRGSFRMFSLNKRGSRLPRATATLVVSQIGNSARGSAVGRKPAAFLSLFLFRDKSGDEFFTDWLSILSVLLANRGSKSLETSRVVVPYPPWERPLILSKTHRSVSSSHAANFSTAIVNEKNQS